MHTKDFYHLPFTSPYQTRPKLAVALPGSVIHDSPVVVPASVSADEWEGGHLVVGLFGLGSPDSPSPLELPEAKALDTRLNGALTELVTFFLLPVLSQL